MAVIPKTTSKMRINLKSYDHRLIGQSSKKIIDTIERIGAKVSGPIPLPTEKQVITILRSTHVNKDSREQFEMRTHKRLIDVIRPSKKVIDSLMNLELPAGVKIEVKV